ncbi:hypothetical protein MJG53_017695 [Ovis ammon polii x Ovis aries]|uniref:Uncharacterized protein n=2 Tax=Ovis TaxID=9935 RepID=A0A836CSL7_SHEEP|nr:hypothetical protein JEQ12_010849 [Ovis aries]KAI4561066.1 hypothetical protein MJG53_017695 [Ovis ammon polii x Ovis aries]
MGHVQLFLHEEKLPVRKGAAQLPEQDDGSGRPHSATLSPRSALLSLVFCPFYQSYWAPDGIWSSNSEGAWGTLGRLTTLMNPAEVVSCGVINHISGFGSGTSNCENEKVRSIRETQGWVQRPKQRAASGSRSHRKRSKRPRLRFAVKVLGKAPRSDVIFPSGGPYRVVRKASEGSGEGWKALGTVRAKKSLEEAADRTKKQWGADARRQRLQERRGADKQKGKSSVVWQPPPEARGRGSRHSARSAPQKRSGKLAFPETSGRRGLSQEDGINRTSTLKPRRREKSLFQKAGAFPAPRCADAQRSLPVRGSDNE